MFEDIKSIAPSVVYLSGNGENVPPPVNADLVNAVFVEAGGYIAGFTTLTEEERAAITALLESGEQVFTRPLRAPSITVDDIFVESCDIKDDPEEAFSDALSEGAKGKGDAKSLDLITRSMLRKMERMDAEIKQLKKDVKRMEKG